LDKFFIPKDVIISHEDNNKWLLMNVFSKTSLAVETRCLEVLNNCIEMNEKSLCQMYKDQQWLIWKIKEFSNSKGLLADPTRYVRNSLEWDAPKTLDISNLIETLQEEFILIKNEKKYREKFQNKKSILDYSNFGNFHDQLGQHLMMELRESPEKWWLQQKFDENLKSIKNNLYSAIQAKFLDSYFRKKIKSGSKVVDIGCGIGFYSNMMAKNGAHVLGIDPNPEYVKIAQKNGIDGTEFKTMNIGFPKSLNDIPTSSADYVFMSDALLFYFVPIKKENQANIQTLFSDIRRILKKDGKFISVEPHYIFWLLPWLGEENYPFTILTEYMNKKFGVTTSISNLIQSYCEGGFSVSWMEELLPHASFESNDPRGYNFAKEFPLWQLFELTPIMTKIE
jgi:SAM-dependent methyltransferase